MDSFGKEGSSYLDGVPVKVSSKFIPPRPVPLPYTYDDKLNFNILDEVYDFSLEKSVIEHHANRLFQLEQAKVKPPSGKKSSSEDNASCSGSTQEESQHSTVSNAQNVLSWSGNSILQPQLQNIQDKTYLENIPQEKAMKINLSDFENDTSSPFDYMELQTINDLEELSSVFQGIQPEEKPQSESTSVKNKYEIFSGVSKSKSFPTSAKDEESEEVGHGSLPVSSYEIPHMISDFPNDSFLKLSQVPYISSNAGSQAEPSIARVPSLLRVSKSYSDISSLGKEEDEEMAVPSERERSRTPPSTFPDTFCSQNSEELPLNNVTSINGECDNDLPDPYEELDNAAKEFVNSITEMGFSRPQVSRTVKHLGTDEKKVVEHLCQIQALEESGYEGLEAEAALHLHDYNRDAAKIFLDLVSQFQDLGFEKKAVKKALVQNKNDWNKTIDALLIR